MKYLRFLSKVEQAKINEAQRDYQLDYQSYYQKLVAKKLKLEQEQKQKQCAEPKMETLKLERIQSEHEEQIQKQNQLKPVIVPRTVMHKKLSCKIVIMYIQVKHDIEITEKQQQYVLLSIREFEEQLKNYNNWRQSNIKKVMGKYNDEDKHTIHLTFEVPKIDILKRIDEKEGA
ncbi:unnamed protein product [Paramecium sonneborni]|uniref:Uncharacterized protein n=1 Tax=Paramecium sonneborni TaxID=65129 RepID=A0A8S1R1Y7_9CILI|nr:unnamed protein product [Paramecium sonneborni]